MCVTYTTVFFFNDTATTEIYTLSLHDALPISLKTGTIVVSDRFADASVAYQGYGRELDLTLIQQDRKSTRLNSSHW